MKKGNMNEVTHFVTFVNERTNLKGKKLKVPSTTRSTKKDTLWIISIISV